MKINVHWEDIELVHDAATSEHVGFAIFVTCQGQVYPADNWNDYGAVMLRMWAREIASVLAGESLAPTFFFLDGPSPLVGTVVPDSSMLRIAEMEGKITFDCSVSAYELGREILVAADAVISTFRRLRICDSDAKLLEAELSRLRPLTGDPTQEDPRK